MKNHSNRKPITFANNRFASSGNDTIQTLFVFWIALALACFVPLDALAQDNAFEQPLEEMGDTIGAAAGSGWNFVLLILSISLCIGIAIIGIGALIGVVQNWKKPLMYLGSGLVFLIFLQFLPNIIGSVRDNATNSFEQMLN